MTVSNASVDAAHSCPAGASNAAYDLHAQVDVHNSTSNSVTIKTITADMTLEASGGTWEEKIGDRYSVAAARFTPESVGSGATTTVQLTVPSACTNSKTGTGGKSHGDYQVTLHLATSSGSFSVTSKNLHTITAA